VFTGDTLFSGATGRTDLYGEKNREKLSGTLYDSLHQKLLSLGDGVIVCPAHGQGSVCGAEISDHEYTTIGYEKKTNALLGKSKKDFIKYKTKEHHYIPPYFQQMEKLNKKGAPILGNLPNLNVLKVKDLKRLVSKEAQLLDIRSPLSFASGHILGSLNIWRKGIPMHSGYFLDYHHPIVIIDDFNQNLEDTVKKLIRLGYDNIVGYLKNGFSTWINSNEEIGKIDFWTPKKLYDNLDNESVFIVDVRDISNWTKPGHIRNANHIYVGELGNNLNHIPRNKQIVVYCDSGFKTSIASSFLKRNKFPQVSNLLGGILAWDNAGYELEK
jgi:hydroxyacylglutathione hydrolase